MRKDILLTRNLLTDLSPLILLSKISFSVAFSETKVNVRKNVLFVQKLRSLNCYEIVRNYRKENINECSLLNNDSFEHFLKLCHFIQLFSRC